MGPHQCDISLTCASEANGARLVFYPATGSNPVHSGQLSCLAIRDSKPRHRRHGGTTPPQHLTIVMHGRGHTHSSHQSLARTHPLCVTNSPTPLVPLCLTSLTRIKWGTFPNPRQMGCLAQ